MLLWYPTVTADGANYVRLAVKIEAGAKSALDPYSVRIVTPYVAQDLTDTEQAVPNITTVAPDRTFWDIVVILHGLRRWWDRRGELRGGGQRVSQPARLRPRDRGSGSYALVPHDTMLTNLEQDYNAMSQMIFGEIPAFAAIIEPIVKLETRLNGKE